MPEYLLISIKWFVKTLKHNGRHYWKYFHKQYPYLECNIALETLLTSLSFSENKKKFRTNTYFIFFALHWSLIVLEMAPKVRSIMLLGVPYYSSSGCTSFDFWRKKNIYSI